MPSPDASSENNWGWLTHTCAYILERVLHRMMAQKKRAGLRRACFVGGAIIDPPLSHVMTVARAP
jgi:hypothetical protein